MIETSPNPQVLVLKNYADLCEETVRRILSVSEETISTRGRFSLVLSGGLTPQGVYTLMADPAYRDRFQWKNIHLFWGDERWVSPEDAKSNYRMVFESLLSKVNIPSGNIHPIQTKHVDPQTSARLYEETIRTFFKLKKDEWPRFNLILLGLGQDGHVVSIFPGNPVLLEKDLIAMAVSQKGIDTQRITLTLPVINHAETILFLVSGNQKTDIVHQVLKDGNNSLIPANRIKLGQEKVWWFLDRASASKWMNITT